MPILQGNLPALGNLNLQGLQMLAAQGQAVANQEGGHYSDTTASAAGSDDEGSTAATDGSTLRTSPAEQARVNYCCSWIICNLNSHRYI